jgi:hypothetical protein
LRKASEKIDKDIKATNDSSTINALRQEQRVLMTQQYGLSGLAKLKSITVELRKLIDDAHVDRCAAEAKLERPNSTHRTVDLIDDDISFISRKEKQKDVMIIRSSLRGTAFVTSDSTSVALGNLEEDIVMDDDRTVDSIPIVGQNKIGSEYDRNYREGVEDSGEPSVTNRKRQIKTKEKSNSRVSEKRGANNANVIAIDEDQTTSQSLRRSSRIQVNDTAKNGSLLDFIESIDSLDSLPVAEWDTNDEVDNDGDENHRSITRRKKKKVATSVNLNESVSAWKNILDYSNTTGTKSRQDVPTKPSDSQNPFKGLGKKIIVFAHHQVRIPP